MGENSLGAKMSKKTCATNHGRTKTDRRCPSRKSPSFVKMTINITTYEIMFKWEEMTR